MRLQQAVRRESSFAQNSDQEMKLTQQPDLFSKSTVKVQITRCIQQKEDVHNGTDIKRKD